MRVKIAWNRLINAAVVAAVIVVAFYSCEVGRRPLAFEYERHLRVISDIRALNCELDGYHSGSGAYPGTLSVLKNVPKDPWGSDYVYRFPGQHNPKSYDLFSAGPDKRPDTADDDWGQ